MPISSNKYPATNQPPAEQYSPGDTYIRSTPAKARTDYEMGGVAIQDSSQGLLVQQWKIYLNGFDVVIHPTTNPAAAQVLFNQPNISECTLSFDFNMQPLVAFMEGGAMKLRWYDTTRNGYVIDAFTAGDKSPFLTLDDKRPSQVTTADVLLFYIRGSGIYCRALRDRFTVEYTWKDNIAPPPVRIASCGLSTSYRLQLQYTV